jgi:hypothetical protein
MTTTLDIDEVTAFAKAVRRELGDLGPDILDELTDGLEADLADKLADGEPLGDAAAYAAELRAAAGVDPATRPSVADNVRENLADLRSKLAPLLDIPVVAGVAAFVVSLRPLWWVLRAWGLFLLISAGAYPRTEFGTVVLLTLVVLSVQWGRGKWLPWRWTRGALVVASIISALALPAAIANLASAVHYQDSVAGEDYASYGPPAGLVLDGSQVTNIFAYGADGKPLTDVQLFDQDGNPLSLAGQDQDYIEQYSANGDYSYLMPNENVAGRKGWNVFPLQASPEAPGWEAGNGPYVSDVRPPLASVQPLLGYEAPTEEPDDE